MVAEASDTGSGTPSPEGGAATKETPVQPPPEELAAALGVPLFTTDLHIPSYTVGTVGRWRLTSSGFSIDCGYYSGRWAVSGMPVLLRDAHGDGQTWETWMSLSPHEIESQELGCRYAHGHTAVMGLGMGWVAVNMALNPKVERVTVIERDPEVIELFQRSRALNGLPSHAVAKVRIVLADALEWRPDEKVDFLYADIWQSLEEPRTLEDVRRMQANVRAEKIYFWGQELVISACAEMRGKDWADGPDALRRCVAEIIHLPLLFPDDMDYPRMITSAARLRRERWPAKPPFQPVTL